jgi:predicted metal-binding membrane protein
MALFVVVGVTSLAAMVVLAAVVLAEKLWVHGELLARLVGVATLALAVAVLWCRRWHQDSTRPAR